MVDRKQRELQHEPLELCLRAFGHIAQHAGGVLELLAHPTRDHGESLVNWVLERFALLRESVVDELVIYVAPSVLGTSARGMFELPALESLARKMQFQFSDVAMVGGDLRLRARPTV